MLGAVDSNKLEKMMDDEITSLSSSEEHKMEKVILFYLIAREMWEFIKTTTNERCAACCNPEKLQRVIHSCTYLQTLYFVTPSTKLMDIINDLYEESILNINWERIEHTCCTLSMKQHTTKCCTIYFWRTRAKSLEFDTSVRPLLFEIARQGGYFYVISQLMNIFGWEIPTA